MAHTNMIDLRPVKALNPKGTRPHITSANMTAVAEQIVERDA